MSHQGSKLAPSALLFSFLTYSCLRGIPTIFSTFPSPLTKSLSPFQALSNFPCGSDALKLPTFPPQIPLGPLTSLPACPVNPPHPFFPWAFTRTPRVAVASVAVAFSLILVGSTASTPVAQRCGGSC